MNPKKVDRERIIVGTPAVEPVKAVIDITDEMLFNAKFEPYNLRKIRKIRKIHEVLEDPENA